MSTIDEVGVLLTRLIVDVEVAQRQQNKVSWTMLRDFRDLETMIVEDLRTSSGLRREIWSLEEELEDAKRVFYRQRETISHLEKQNSDLRLQVKDLIRRIEQTERKAGVQ